MEPRTVSPAPSTSAPSTSPFLRPGEAGWLLAGAPWRRLAVLGDSVATGEGDPAPGFPDQPWAESLAGALEEAAGPLAYLNTGARGVRTPEVRDLQLARVRAFGPDLAVVACGGNDLMRRSFDPVRHEDEVDHVVAPLAADGALVVTFGLFDLSRTGFAPEALRPDLRLRLRQQASAARVVAERHGGLHVDLGEHAAAGDPDCWSADALHPNRRGQAVVLAELVRALGRHLGTRSAAEG
jgi:lysophospholipase L1-like esterase